MPVHISAVRKTLLLVWLEHADACETEEEVQRFIDRENAQHQISLTGGQPLTL